MQRIMWISVAIALTASTTFGVTFTEDFEGNWQGSGMWEVNGDNVGDPAIDVTTFGQYDNRLWRTDAMHTDNAVADGTVPWTDAVYADRGFTSSNAGGFAFTGNDPGNGITGWVYQFKVEVMYLDYVMKLAPNTTYDIESITYDAFIVRNDGPLPPTPGEVGPSNSPQHQKWAMAQTAYIGTSESLQDAAWEGFFESGEGTGNPIHNEMLGFTFSRFDWNDDEYDWGGSTIYRDKLSGDKSKAPTDGKYVGSAEPRAASFTETIDGTTQITTGDSGEIVFRMSQYILDSGVYSASAIDNLSITLTPEPTSLLLLAVGGGLVLRRRRSV